MKALGEGAGEGPRSDTEVDDEPKPCSEALPHRKKEVNLPFGDFGLFASSVPSEIEGECDRRDPLGRAKLGEADIAKADLRLGAFSESLGLPIFNEDSLQTLAWLELEFRGDEGEGRGVGC